VKSQILLSPTEINWLKDQTLVLPNKSGTRKRIREKVRKCLNTVDFVLSNSSELDQEYVDSMFPAEIIMHILDNLTRYDDTRPFSDDDNKLAIARQAIKLGFEHYQARYKKTKFFYDKIKEINNLLTALSELAATEKSEADQSQLYTMRKKWSGLPPDIMTSGLDDEWRAMCMVCFNWSTGKSKAETVKKIKHHVNCRFNKVETERFIHALPPRNQ